MLEIDLIRHVKVKGKPALYGCTDIAPIASENARLLEFLIAQQQSNKAYHSIVCSPLIRCQRIAKEFSSRSKLPLEISAGFQEMNFGRFDGVPFDALHFDDTSIKAEQGDEDETELRWSQLEAFFHAPAEIVLPDAETLSGFYHRVGNTWQNLIAEQVGVVAKQEGSQAARRVLVIAHGGVIRMILSHILQLDWRQASWHQKLQIGYASMSRIVISQPYKEKQLNYQTTYQQQILHQQVTSIAVPLLEEL